MVDILEMINEPKDLKDLTLEQKKQLCSEIRQKLIETVSKTGGHLASNLGVVELTVAIHSVFNAPEDKVVFDVGHQTYVHKMLTGRKDRLPSIRSLGGLSGFPKREESNYDTFDTGHSGTSISAALGMARARDIRGDNYRVIAVIGDGAMTSGMALEALNDAGAYGTDMIVILNDNEMSIDPNTGGLNSLLSKMRTKPFYRNSNRQIKAAVSHVPLLGSKTIKAVRRLKDGIKQMIIPNMYFEDIGFTYLGIVDGNDYDKIEALLDRAKDLKGPILVHAKTTKGYGYPPAEANPDKFHGISPFDIATGQPLKKSGDDYSAVFGRKLCAIARKNPDVAAITAAMASGTGLLEFKAEFPDRFFDVEIAEQHAVTLAAGMATNGIIPVVAIYSSFFQRAYDQLIHDVCIQNLHVVICLDRSGIVGSDGETHQGLFDLAYLNLIPNIRILAPKNFAELEIMLDFAVNRYDGPIVIRYPRGNEQLKTDNISDHLFLLENGKAEILRSGKDLVICALGKMNRNAIEAADILKTKYAIDATVINVMTLKPLDYKTIFESSQKTGKIVTIEDGTIIGGLYSSICEQLMQQDIHDVRVLPFAYPDRFIKQGTVKEIEDIYGLSPQKMADRIYSSLFETGKGINNNCLSML